MLLPRGDALRAAQRLPLAIIFRAFGAAHSDSEVSFKAQAGATLGPLRDPLDRRLHM